MRTILCTSVALGALGLLTALSPACAEAENEEIIVTARQREEPARDVPFAITVLGADALESRGVVDTLTLFRQSPGLALTSFDDGRFAYFQLRGIGPLTQAISPDDGSVVTYVDGVPQPVYASEFGYFDLARIEVLRGPQGTLFGRNAQGGIINVVTHAPDEDDGVRIRAEAGDEGYVVAQLSGATTLAPDRLFVGGALRHAAQDGFMRNTSPLGGELGDREALAGRVSLVVTPQGEGGPRLTFTANGDRQISRPYYYALRSDQPVVQVDPENRVERTLWGASLTAEVELSALNFTSVTAFNGFDNEQVTDDTDGLIYGPLFGVPASAFLPPLDFSDWHEEESRFYQEVRFDNGDARALDWVAGLAYFQSDFDVLLINRSSFSPFLNGDRDATQRIRSLALFGEANLALSPRLTVSAGARFTREEKDLDAQFTGIGFGPTVAFYEESGEQTYELWTGRASVSYALSEAATLYATIGRGAKSGGYPRFTLNAALGNPSPPYAESTSLTYEAGLKSVLFGGRGRFDAALFYNDVTDEQLFILDFVTFQFLPANIDTRGYGLELEGQYRLSESWSIAGGLAWTDAEITEAGASGAQAGNRIPNVAGISSTLTLDYRGQNGAWGIATLAPFATLTHQYVGERAVDVAESFDLPSYHNVDARFGVAAGNVDLFVFGRNLTDEEQQINGVLYGPGVEAAAYARRRVLGLGVAASF